MISNSDQALKLTKYIQYLEAQLNHLTLQLASAEKEMYGANYVDPSYSQQDDSPMLLEFMRNMITTLNKALLNNNSIQYEGQH